ncbi:hypothetical protein ACQ4M3_26230 [Leptolyngbya sp. AN03gr2]|uniref:hypothetical protein n=1 Tax=unclassified Leptolyngbya TaxID=2650499 RepID=UPI003D3197CA
MLEAAGVSYRKFYNTRHTYISLVLASGKSPVLVAKFTGHDLETLLKHYAGVVGSHPALPEI